MNNDFIHFINNENYMNNHNELGLRFESVLDRVWIKTHGCVTSFRKFRLEISLTLVLIKVQMNCMVN